jgi:hypothetical protein
MPNSVRSRVGLAQRGFTQFQFVSGTLMANSTHRFSRRSSLHPQRR